MVMNYNHRGIYRSQKNQRCESGVCCLNISNSLKECICIHTNNVSPIFFWGENSCVLNLLQDRDSDSLAVERPS